MRATECNVRLQKTASAIGQLVLGASDIDGGIHSEPVSLSGKSTQAEVTLFPGCHGYYRVARQTVLSTESPEAAHHTEIRISVARPCQNVPKCSALKRVCFSGRRKPCRCPGGANCSRRDSSPR